MGFANGPSQGALQVPSSLCWALSGTLRRHRVAARDRTGAGRLRERPTPRSIHSRSGGHGRERRFSCRAGRFPSRKRNGAEADGLWSALDEYRVVMGCGVEVGA